MPKIDKKKYFQIWGDVQSQNTLLKSLLLLIVIINSSLFITVMNLVNIKPLLLSTNHTNQTTIINTKIPSKDFIKNEVKNRIEKFYLKYFL